MKHLYAYILLSILALNGFTQNPNGLHFDGVNDIIETDYSGISGTNSRTVEAWIKTTYVASQQVITDWGAMTTGQRFTFNMIGGKLRCEIGGQGVTGPTAISDNNWHHVAITFNNSSSPKFRLYVDGSLEASFNLSNVTMNTATTNSFQIGERVDGANNFAGVIDEVRVWNYDRSASEISNNMNTEFCTIPSGLVAYHKMNQGTVNITNTGIDESPDVSGNGNDGDLSGFALTGTTSNWVTGYNLSASNVSSSISLTGCDSLISPSGSYVWTQSGTYHDTVQTAQGCDSNMTINLSILDNSHTTISVAECASYISPSGNYTWMQSGQYSDTLPNAVGCDSILTINLSINNTTATTTLSGCEQVISPSGNHVWVQSGTYIDTISNSAGCDSIISIGVTVLSASSKNLAPDACLSYTSPSGNYTWTTSGSYIDTLINAMGCDSILNIELTIKEVNTAVSQEGYKLTAQANNVNYQWLDCDDDFVAISGSNGKTYPSEVDGSFAVRISSNGCVDTSDCFDINIVGIQRLAGNQFLTKTDPSINSILVTPPSAKIYCIKIYDILGKQVMDRPYLQGNTDIRLNDDGLYLIQIESNGSVEIFKSVL
tara:strand:+ start:1142 stop:2944 length:1803 start_codon:yes stop_codon:yes gene_type:complete